MDDLKTAWLKKKKKTKLNSLPVPHVTGRSLAAGAFDRATLPLWSPFTHVYTFPAQRSAKIHPDIIKCFMGPKMSQTLRSLSPFRTALAWSGPVRPGLAQA